MKRNTRVIYSFDLFDTCFIRACGAPRNVFDLLAYRVLGANSDESARADFALERVKGERKARALSQVEEITLEAIYVCCDFMALTAQSKTEIARLEMQVEREQLVPVYAIREKIKTLHREGHSVYYISDMYLPRTFLSELLIEHGFWREGDKLYVSSACGKTKHTGNLYKHIAAENGLRFKDWYHWGDNRHSDYRIPRRMGIKASLIHHVYSVYERFLVRQDYFPGFFVNQHLAGLSRAVRLAFPDEPRYAFAADLIAPLYVAFVYHVLRDAVSRGIRSLFFLARDGYILYRIAKELEGEFPGLRMKYLYVSRSSLYLPGLPAITPDSLLSLRKTMFGFTDETELDILGNFITSEPWHEVECVMRSGSGSGKGEELFANPEVLAILSRYHDTQRDLILRYFIQEGLADPIHKTVVVDIRGTRSCQQAINAILRQGGFRPAEGYYLEVVDERKPIQEAGDYHALYYAERMRLSSSLRYISDELGSILEQYFSVSPHKRTIAYLEDDGRVRPVFENGEKEGDTRDLMTCHEETVALFTRLFMRNYLYLHLPVTLALATQSLAYFSQRPVYSYLKALRAIRVNSKKGHYAYIVKRLSPMELKRHTVNWRRGSVYFTLRTTMGYRYINRVFLFGVEALKRLLSHLNG